jgi:carbon monoxide dehydrogenase subunit G
VAEVEYATTAKLPVQTIWEFVCEMDNWAPFLTGYQTHEKQSDDESLWTLKGDLGSMTRTVKFQVDVTEWAGPERVTFNLKGLNEAIEGQGEFRMERYEDETPDSGGSAEPGEPGEPAAPAARSRNPGFFGRLMTAILRFFFRQKYGETERGEHANAGRGEGMARLEFKLRLDAGGPMAPMVNAMIKPAMQVAAEDLANRIIGHLEARDSRPA